MNVNAEMTKLDRESLVGSGEQTSIETDVGLRGMAAVLPIHTRDLEELQRSKLLVSDRSALEELGFEKVHVCDATHDINWLALESARRAMGEAEVERGEIDVLIWASALSETLVRNQTAARPTPIEELLSGFNYRASWLQEELHLDNARVNGRRPAGMRRDVQRTFHGARLACFRLVLKERPVRWSRCLTRRRSSRNSLQFDQ